MCPLAKSIRCGLAWEQSYSVLTFHLEDAQMLLPVEN